MIKKIYISIILICVVLFGFSWNFVSAQDASDNYGITATAGKAELPTETNLPYVIGQIIGALLSFVGVIFFVLIIYGGFLWMTAGGNEEQVKKAVNIVTQASIGLAIVASAYLITRFVGEAVLSSLISSK